MSFSALIAAVVAAVVVAVAAAAEQCAQLLLSLRWSWVMPELVLELAPVLSYLSENRRRS